MSWKTFCKAAQNYCDEKHWQSQDNTPGVPERPESVVWEKLSELFGDFANKSAEEVEELAAKPFEPPEWIAW